MALEDYKNTMWRCVHCNCCKWPPVTMVKSWRFAMVCPSYARYYAQPYSGGGKQSIGVAWLEGRLDWSDELLTYLYRCQMCGACDISCKYNMDHELLEPIREMRTMAVEAGQLLPQHVQYIEGLRKEDNMMLEKKVGRGKWSEGLAVKDITKENAEVYYHAGCRACFDEEYWPVARASLTLLKNAGVDVGIAGKEELCCGGRAFDWGFRGELVKYAESMVDLWEKAKVKTVVTPCADGYWSFKYAYPLVETVAERFKKFEVLHTTEYLERLVKEGKIKPKSEVPMVVTYHDPCHLGRLGEEHIPWKGKEYKVLNQLPVQDPPKEWRRGTNGVYEPPRNILKSIAGVELVEMQRIKEYAFCCGAAGGVKEAYPDFALWTANERIEEAKSTGAEALVTACPWCERNFKDAIKESGERIKVYDVVELLQEAI